jgi:gluconate 2-dehydrogenase gamma chain
MTTRREVLKSIGVSAGAAAALPFLSEESAAALEQVRKTNGAPVLRFFTRAQYHTVDVLAERIIPGDERSGGAHAARVADFIDLFVFDSPPAIKTAWTEGLHHLDQASRQHNGGKAFVLASAEQQMALLTEMSRNEADPKTPLEEFFREAKTRTVQGYYTSKIGIHDELHYKGNQFLQEFVGYKEQA